MNRDPDPVVFQIRIPPDIHIRLHFLPYCCCQSVHPTHREVYYRFQTGLSHGLLPVFQPVCLLWKWNSPVPRLPAFPYLHYAAAEMYSLLYFPHNPLSPPADPHENNFSHRHILRYCLISHEDMPHYFRQAAEMYFLKHFPCLLPSILLSTVHSRQLSFRC